MSKYTEVADFIRKRVSKGDYSLRGVPAERSLAAEIGVSYMTVRRAIRALIEDGTLIRQPNGRVAVGLLTQGNGSQLQLAFLAPTFNSPVIEQWRVALDAIVRKRGGVVRPILYMHWDDPIVQDALEAFDGVFLIPIPEALPAHVASRLKTARRLVVLDQDYSHMGIPSVRLFPPVFVQRLLDYLEKLGHRHIDCLNLHPENPDADPVLKQRVEQWKVWTAAHAAEGQLIDVPQSLHSDPFKTAYEAMTRRLDTGAFNASAIMCVTAPGAIGAMRALHDHGMTPGREVSVCTINSESMGETLIPSLTALEPPSPAPYLSVCIDWIVEGGQAWSGPLLLQPAEIPLVIRESTGKNLPHHGSAKRAKARA
jgi:DNA-binding LacI/PurR family transcriptional regulator